MNIAKLSKKQFPEKLLEIPQPPDYLYVRGNMPEPDYKKLCVVGARKYTQYGKDICEKLIQSLHGLPVVIISGLALGIDTIAHKAALAAGLQTIAVPGSGVNADVLYPATNRNFAEKIIESGGGLLSEFEPDFVSTAWAFPKRNRIMAALSDAVLIIEAEKKSGTLITARLATDYNRDVLAVPGSVFSKNSEGPHLLLRLGATPITSSKDLREALGFPTEPDPAERTYEDCSPQEKIILEILRNPMSRDELMYKSKLSVSEVNMCITLLEMKGYIQERLGELNVI